MSTNEINLSILPSDIIRKVINFAGMSAFEDMRLISPLWNETALAHIEDSKSRPAINVFRWWPHNTNLPNIWNMEITIAKENVNYFGLGSWNLTSNQQSESENKVLLGRRLSGVQEPWMRKRIVRLFARCSRIEKIELDLSRTEDLKSLSEVTGGTTIANLVIERVEHQLTHLENTIFDFIDQHSVQTLTLNDYSPDKEHLASFINSVMSLVAKLELIIVADSDNAFMASILRRYWESTMDNIKSQIAAKIDVRIEEFVQENGFKKLRTIIERTEA